jgi:hypothetical protein
VGELVTIDEKLEKFRGNCPFRKYIASKPGKYGIKIYALVDYRIFYTQNFMWGSNPKDHTNTVIHQLKL